VRILYTVTGYKPAYRMGGPVISVAEVAERLASRGHELIVFTSNSDVGEDLDVPVNQPVDVDEVEVWYFSHKNFFKRWLPFIPYLSKSVGFMYNPLISRQLDRLMPEIDVVNTHNAFEFSSCAAAWAAQRWHKPLFYHQRGVFDPGRLKFRSIKKKLFIDLVGRPIMRRATTLIALTQAELENYRALGVETPCRIVPNGIEVNTYRRHPGPTALPWKIPPQAQVILYLGRLHPWKGVDRLLEAFLQVQSILPKAFLVMAGGDDWGYIETFIRQAQQAGAADRVILPGMVTGEAKLDLLARANLFCMPSDGEGFSMAVLEAMASATPVLLSPGCHFPEAERAEAGRVVPATPAALAEAFIDMLSQPERLRVMGQRGFELVKDNYSWDHITDQLLKVYREGLARHGAGGYGNCS
jgi:glycosyltransferase involved in cell wall biosynthesis